MELDLLQDKLEKGKTGQKNILKQWKPFYLDKNGIYKCNKRFKTKGKDYFF